MSDYNILLERFHDIASNPGKQLRGYLESGKKVAGVTPVYTPEEIVHSMGIVPMGLWGADVELSESKRYFPTFICSIMQSIIELGIKGTYNGLSFVMMPSLCDSMQVAAENWKWAVPTIPVIFADWPHNRSLAGHDYIVATHKRQIEQIKEITGADYSDAALADSIAVYKEHAEIMKAFSKKAGECGMKASDRQAVFKSAWFMLKEEHTAMVKELMETMVPSEDKCINIMTTGILADQPDLLKAMDEMGFNIVWDDVAHESRQYYVEYEGDNPLDILANKFCNMKHCSLIYDYDKTRISLVINEAKQYGAKAFVYIQTKFCDPEEFDYVFLKREAEKAGIPIVMLEVDRQMTNYDQAKTALQTLKEML